MTSLTQALGPKLIARIRAMPLPRRIKLREAMKAKLDAMTPQQQVNSPGNNNQHIEKLREMVSMLDSGLSDTRPTNADPEK